MYFSCTYLFIPDHTVVVTFHRFWERGFPGDSLGKLQQQVRYPALPLLDPASPRSRSQEMISVHHLSPR